MTLQSIKQNVVARSSAKAEFRAIAQGICEVVWIKRLLEYLKILSQSSQLLIIYIFIIEQSTWKLINTLSKKKLIVE